jgi:uncharacterized protein
MAMSTQPVTTQMEAPISSAPPRFHLLAKPSGSTCNLDCTYCFFLSKELLYPNEKHRMQESTLETYIRQLLEAHQTPNVTIAWQGGEPTLMGLDFFRKSAEMAEKYKKPGQTVEHTFQTNGVLLDDEWCAFLKQHNFLVGLSVDGPKEIHDTYRVNKGGQGTFDQVLRGWKKLREHGVEVNVLCAVHAANQNHGKKVYTFFRDQLGARYMQFIPIVERTTRDFLPLANLGWSERPGGQRLLYTQSGSVVTERTVGGEKYGRFLVDIFEEWIRQDVGSVFVQLFDVTLNSYFGRHTLCVHSPTCGDGPALEHNGDLYSCDHYVEPKYLLGNIHETHMTTMMASAQQRRFGLDKRDTLTSQCRMCEVRLLCHGGCPKDRFIKSKEGETGHNYLCEGLYHFFTHTKPAMTAMAQLVRRNRFADEVMAMAASEDAKRGRNSLCSCGSGRKLKQCHGKAPSPDRRPGQ